MAGGNELTVPIPLTEKQRYQLSKRREVVGVQYWGVADNEPPGARGGYFLAGQAYSGEDIAAVHAWAYERAYDYPSLKKFEGGARWPTAPELDFVFRDRSGDIRDL